MYCSECPQTTSLVLLVPAAKSSAASSEQLSDVVARVQPGVHARAARKSAPSSDGMSIAAADLFRKGRDHLAQSSSHDVRSLPYQLGSGFVNRRKLAFSGLRVAARSQRSWL